MLKVLLLVELQFFSHCLKVLSFKEMQIAQLQFIVKTFHGSCAVLDIYASLGQEVSTQNDILFTSL